MNILETILSYDEYVRTPGIDISPSEITSKSNYQRWLAKNKTPTTHKLPLETRVNSVIGTSIHKYAEHVLKSTNFKGYSEISLVGDIAGYTVGGTADVIYEYEDTYIVGDFKSVGVYQLKKAMKDNFKNYIPQLSIYSYLFARSMGERYSRLGELYFIITGDAGYFKKEDGGGKTPKYFTETIELLSKEEIEELVSSKMKAIETEPPMDCADWQCNWCNFECPYRDSDSTKDF